MRTVVVSARVEPDIAAKALMLAKLRGCKRAALVESGLRRELDAAPELVEARRLLIGDPPREEVAAPG